jgi:hypothetical protein
VIRHHRPLQKQAAQPGRRLAAKPFIYCFAILITNENAWFYKTSSFGGSSLAIRAKPTTTTNEL